MHAESQPGKCGILASGREVFIEVEVFLFSFHVPTLRKP
jgi:hypothetical protein